MAPSATLPVSVAGSNSKTQSNWAEEGDWRAKFDAEGYVVIKNVIPRDRAVAYQQSAFDWLKSFGTELDINNPATWIKKNLPVHSDINAFSNYSVMHEKFVWDARQEPGVLSAFSELWGTNELLVSFDSLNITFPNRKDVKGRVGWQHVDQSPFRRGMECVQGIISLSHAGSEDGGLMVYPRSHLLTEEFFDTMTDKATWTKKDIYFFNETQLQWFAERGIQPHKVCAEPGDLILWDSRLIHLGTEPNPSSHTIRTIIYATYTPASWAKKEALEEKAAIFKRWAGTTHWPHENIVYRDQVALLDDGTVDPRNRTEPLTKPEITDQLLRLAGVKSY